MRLRPNTSCNIQTINIGHEGKQRKDIRLLALVHDSKTIANDNTEMEDIERFQQDSDLLFCAIDIDDLGTSKGH